MFFLKSPLWEYIDRKYRPGTSVNVYLLSLIEKIKSLPSEPFETNVELYDFFGLTTKEIFKVEENTKGKSGKTRKNKESISKNSSTTNSINKSKKNLKKNPKKNKPTKKKNTKKGGSKKTRKNKSLFNYNIW